jgi:PadR family transcriptional regulator, regulatory protein PadR
MATPGPRMTPQTVAVVEFLLAEPSKPHYGLDVARETGLKTGTVHPILTRLQQAGWITSFWEDPADHEDTGRPRRRYYQFTGEGERAARKAIAATGPSTGLSGLRPQTGY